MEFRTLPVIYLVVPCYNEEEVLVHTANELRIKMKCLISDCKISKLSKVLFVNDGSTDNTAKMLAEFADDDYIFAVINLAKNSGHQAAIMAGMMFAKQYADAVITIDADLQQDIDKIDDFIAKFMDGCDIVYGVRNNRNTDCFFKKFTAYWYYKTIGFLSNNSITNHADYRLMSKRSLHILEKYTENDLCLRNLIPTMGLPSSVVYFDVKERPAGKSKYTLGKMITLALDGITSASIKPLRLIGCIGFITLLFTIGLAVFTFIDRIFGNAVPGYTTLLLAILLLGGVNLCSLGVIGEYIGKTYMNVKNRPRYIIDTTIWRE